MDPETVDQNDDIKWNLLQSDFGLPEAEESPAPEEKTTEGGKLPVEPGPSSGSDDPSRAVALRNELFTFFYYIRSNWSDNFFG